MVSRKNRFKSVLRRVGLWPVKVLRVRLFELSLLFGFTILLYLISLTFFLKTVVIFFRN
jgi:hypothetical protein